MSAAALAISNGERPAAAATPVASLILLVTRALTAWAMKGLRYIS
jgi:hypothetical protein